MASQWALVDDQFPHFQGDESVPEQIRALVNYMFVLVEQLKYNLSNLKAENWNDASLEAFASETTDAATKTLEEPVAKLEESLRLLTGALSEHMEDYGKLKQQIEGEKGLAQQVAVLTQILQHIEETVTLGGEGKEIRIIGKAVYVNDTLIGGAVDETS